MSTRRETPWWQERDGIDVFALDWSGEDLAEATKLLQAPHGVVPADVESWYRGGLGCLTTYLKDLRVPPRSVLANRRDAFLERARPFLPHDSTTTRPVDFHEHMGWIDPGRILLKLPGRESLIHDNSNAPGRAVPAEEGILDFAERIADEGGHTHSLRRLFGDLDTELPYLDVEGWALPSGSIFRVYFNGNHRLTALAILGVPCVLARIHWRHGPFDAASRESIDDSIVGGRIHNYRRLLHTFGAAAFSSLEAFNVEDIRTEWPILLTSPENAVKSLAAAEELVGRRYGGLIGEMPREWFTDAEFLDHIGSRLASDLAGWRSRPVRPHY